jgi:hypothetical protein
LIPSLNKITNNELKEKNNNLKKIIFSRKFRVKDKKKKYFLFSYRIIKMKKEK